MTAAVCTSCFSSGGKRSRRAASTAWIVVGQRQVRAWAGRTCGAVQLSSSRKKGFPAAFVTISWPTAAGSRRRLQHALHHQQTLLGRQPRQRHLGRTRLPEPGGLIPGPVA